MKFLCCVSVPMRWAELVFGRGLLGNISSLTYPFFFSHPVLLGCALNLTVTGDALLQ